MTESSFRRVIIQPQVLSPRLNTTHIQQEFRNASETIFCVKNRPETSLSTHWKSFPPPNSLIFMSLFLHQIWRNASVSQQWMLCSEWVPSEWESDKHITIIHTTPVHQLMSHEVKSNVFIRNKSTIKTFWLQTVESSIHSIFSSSEKHVWSESGEKYALIKHRLQTKTVLTKYVGGFYDVWGQQETFSLEEVLLWITDF